jgi:hypothetical protein
MMEIGVSKEDKALLEIAERAPGVTMPPMRDPYAAPWNPLLYDSHAYRLLVDLRASLFVDGNSVMACAYFDDRDFEVSVDILTDKYAASRRALVHLAIAITVAQEGS